MYIRILMMVLTSMVLAGSACQKSSSGITVIQNVKGYTLSDGQLISFGSLVFRDGKVLEISTDGMLKTDTPAATVVDGAGNVLLPGLIDAHGHVMGLGYQTNVHAIGDRGKGLFQE